MSAKLELIIAWSAAAISVALMLFIASVAA